MADRVRTEQMIHGGRYERPWVAYLDGQLLRDGRGGVRRFKTEAAARDAGLRRSMSRGVPGTVNDQQEHPHG